MIGRIGEAEKEGETKQKIAKIHATTAVLETERKVEKANADQKLKTREIAIARELNLEQIAADRAAEERDAELSKAVEEKRAHMELERLRATTVVQAKIARESAQEKADADLYSSNKKADAQQYNQQAEADAIYNRTQKDAEADLYKRTKQAEARERDAEAAYTAKKREAEGLIEMSKAYGAMADVLGGPQGLMQYLMLTNGVYEKMAQHNAQAINGLQPKINVWTTGNGDGADSTAPIRNLFQSLPPLLSTIQDQTGMQPPAWLAQMPQQQQAQVNGEMSVEEKVAKKQQMLANGHK